MIPFVLMLRQSFWGKGSIPKEELHELFDQAAFSVCASGCTQRCSAANGGGFSWVEKAVEPIADWWGYDDLVLSDHVGDGIGRVGPSTSHKV